MDASVMEKIIALCKRRGFMYPGSDLYGGVANTYDYGPMGAELLRNIKNLWWEHFVTKRDDIVGLDASTISHAKIWEASGHTAGFADALVDCKNCKARIRADHLLESALKINVEGLPLEDLEKLITDNNILCPNCGKHAWTKVRKFNLLFPVHLGIVEGDQDLAYLRGETAQGMFVNFNNIVNSTRVRLPFGIAQAGKAFRNEITPGQSVFRTLEFDLAEVEYFFDPAQTDWEAVFENWKEQMLQFVTTILGINKDNLRFRPHTDEERSFYSTRTEDLEYNFPFGFKELWGLAYRSDYDLQQHMKFSGKELSIVDPLTNKKITPHVIEPAVGLNRLFLMTLVDGFVEAENRVFLRLSPKIAPVKAAVFPLLANKPELTSFAKEIFETLKSSINGKIMWDNRGNIGKRYLSQDEVGTPFCITVDFQSLEDKTVTIRHRDTAQQERIAVSELVTFLKKFLSSSPI